MRGFLGLLLCGLCVWPLACELTPKEPCLSDADCAVGYKCITQACIRIGERPWRVEPRVAERGVVDRRQGVDGGVEPVPPDARGSEGVLEPRPEPAPPERRAVACPQSCKSHADCDVGPCGSKTLCGASGRCEEPSHCPGHCRNDDDCTLAACGPRRTCVTATQGTPGTCTELFAGACPSSCARRDHCRRKDCGARLFCNPYTRTCVENIGMCPSTCTTNADCDKRCGPRRSCVKESPSVPGSCQLPNPRSTCPSSCATSADCHVSDCKDRKYCDLTTQRCTAAAEVCPRGCREDSDCQRASCFGRTSCYRHNPTDRYGTCEAKEALSCPQSCQSHADCFLQGCGDRSACSIRGFCVRPGQLCPLTCLRHSECKAAACGRRRFCVSGTCQLPCASKSCQTDDECKDGCNFKRSCHFYSPDSTSGVCVSQPLPPLQCPRSCASSDACLTSGCNGKWYCNPHTQKCSAQGGLCPRSCNTDGDCPAARCGVATTCVEGRCQDAACRRGATCFWDRDCSLCGKRTYCRKAAGRFGKCVEPPAKSCPSSCYSFSDCPVRCGNRDTCHPDKRVCAQLSELCPSACLKDGDCPASRCGARTACLLLPGAKAGRCQIPASGACPGHCEFDRDCARADCGSKSLCDRRTHRCVVPGKSCPSQCTSDANCSVALCGSGARCLKSHPEHSRGQCGPVLAGVCPAFCASHGECQVSGCRERRYCNTYTGKCVASAGEMCPISCTSNANCAASRCGAANRCVQLSPTNTTRSCIEVLSDRSCPSSCRFNSDCYKSGCNDRLYCNRALGACTTLANACPTSCTSNADCSAAKCGKHTRCLKAPGQSRSFCAEVRQNPVCPASCTHDGHCRVSGCKERLFCNTSTHRCTDGTAICPSSCSSNADCTSAKCGKKRACIPTSPGSSSRRCQERRAVTCPSRCLDQADCYAQGCLDRLYCNYDTQTCVASQAQLCPSSCKSDLDCRASRCGVKSACRKNASGAATGTCQIKGATSCPAACFSTADCFVTGCADRIYCSKTTNRCVSAGD